MKFYTIIAAFNPIEWVLRLFGKLLAFFDSLTGYYILSIFIFAVIAKIILFPFGIVQQKNTLKQAKLRPKEQAIRNKYKGRNDQATQQKVQQEVMDLYQSEGYSPYSGCLPLLVQFPIIIGLYEIIRNPLKYTCGLSDEIITNIKNTINFLGTDVLQGVDNLFKNGVFSGSSGLDYMTVLKNEANFNAIAERVDIGIKYSDLPNFNFLGFDLSVTPMQFFENGRLWYYLLIPILTFAFTYLSVRITRKMTYQPLQQPNDNGCSGKMMDVTMPLLSTWFAFMFPSMLGVYWIFNNNLLGILQSFILKKMYPLPVFSAEDYKAAERELKGRQPKSIEDDARVISGKKYVSLHHIDDDDYDEKGNYIGKPEEESKGSDDAEDRKPASGAPVLKDDDPHGNKNNKK